MQTDSTGGLAAAASAGRLGGPGRTHRHIEVSDLRASQVADYARRRAASGTEVHVERRGGRTFLVTAD